MEQAIAEHGSIRSGNYLASSPIRRRSRHIFVVFDTVGYLPLSSQAVLC